MKITINLSKILLLNNKNIPNKFELSFRQDTITLEELISELNKLYPSINYNSTLVIINGKIISDNQTQIHNEDNVNFFPPIMGG